MTVYLIRHTAVNVAPGICYGQTDVPLRDTFLAEAHKVSCQLKGIPFDVVFTSPLSRCTKLADYCGFPDAVRDARLMELNFGAWEMKRYDDIVDPQLSAYYADYLHVNATGGESFIDQLKRVTCFLDELKAKDFRQVAIFAHGGVLICAQIYAGLIKADETAFNALTPYGGVIEIEI